MITDDTKVKVGLCFSSVCLVRAASNLLNIRSKSRRVTQALAGLSFLIAWAVSVVQHTESSPAWTEEALRMSSRAFWVKSSCFDLFTIEIALLLCSELYQPVPSLQTASCHISSLLLYKQACIWKITTNASALRQSSDVSNLSDSQESKHVQQTYVQQIDMLLHCDGSDIIQIRTSWTTRKFSFNWNLLPGGSQGEFQFTNPHQPAEELANHFKLLNSSRSCDL